MRLRRCKWDSRNTNLIRILTLSFMHSCFILLIIMGPHPRPLKLKSKTEWEWRSPTRISFNEMNPTKTFTTFKPFQINQSTSTNQPFILITPHPSNKPISHQTNQTQTNTIMNRMLACVINFSCKLTWNKITYHEQYCEVNKETNVANACVFWIFRESMCVWNWILMPRSFQNEAQYLESF